MGNTWTKCKASSATYIPSWRYRMTACADEFEDFLETRISFAIPRICIYPRGLAD